MSGFDWLNEFVTRMQSEHVLVQASEAHALAPAQGLTLDVEDWGNAARIAANFGCRWAGGWGDVREEFIVLHACLAYQGDYLLLHTEAPVTQPVVPSHTPYYPGADRLERHLQDMFGIVFSDHPDPRRWTRHKAWPADQYPLRPDFPVAGLSPKRTPADSDYAFVPVLGNGVYAIPVGPVHAGIIEPGHFRFHVVGEDVLRLEQRLGYVHKGIEKIAVGRDPFALARLAGRVSGDSTVAHTWAACMALERAAKVTVPSRALALRAILSERERIANHLGDIGAICNDVAFAFMQIQFSKLREEVLRLNHAAFGHRLLMDRIVPGGVACDLNMETIAQLRAQHDGLAQTVKALNAIINDYPSLEDRLVATGILPPEKARQLGVLGYVGKASGQDYDVRRDHGYAPYDQLPVESPCLSSGDVAARMQIRALEIDQSISLLQALLNTLPGGDIQTTWTTGAGHGEGLGIVEGWRGEIISYVRLGEDSKVQRFFTRDPSWFSWPALEHLIHGNIVADFPVCNKSVNGSYSGHDL
ncbi:MAG: Ni,Fe-hydrogenase III large subunit [Gammaproteobacteria bacterium]|nr:Ni,Fe-hydrogenase III large subunit [Gammaproteobacteria bacterium]